LKSILALMEELAATGASAEEVLEVFLMTKDRVDAKSKVAKDRDKVLNSLRDYLMTLCGSVDESVMSEFEDGLIKLENIYKQITVVKVKDVNELDALVDEIIRKNRNKREL